MELDNFIYIILIVVIFVVSLLGSTRKKKIPGPVVATDEVKYSLNDFEKILERKQEYQKIEEPNTVIDEIIPEILLEEGTQKVNRSKSTKQINKKDDNEINDGFDIKSAIIYSSILERKKFRH
jgi:hypothetical protein